MLAKGVAPGLALLLLVGLVQRVLDIPRVAVNRVRSAAQNAPAQLPHDWPDSACSLQS
jgi:hypothetical protein